MLTPPPFSMMSVCRRATFGAKAEVTRPRSPSPTLSHDVSAARASFAGDVFLLPAPSSASAHLGLTSPVWTASRIKAPEQAAKAPAPSAMNALRSSVGGGAALEAQLR